MATLTHTTGKFTARGGHQLFEQSWIPAEAHANLIIIHGLGEHSSRYGYVAEKLTDAGYACFAYDQYGHGQSDGDRAVVYSFDTLGDDLEQFVGRIKQQHSDRPTFILGHSMGGTVVLYLTTKRPPNVSGLVIIAPALKAGTDISPIAIKLSPLLGKYFPKLGTTQLKAESVSRSPETVASYISDPLNFHDKIPASTGAQMLHAFAYIRDRMAKIDLPILILHGTDDKMTNVEGSLELHAGIEQTDKALKLYDGFYHELLNEPERDQVIADITEWFNAHLEAPQAKESSVKKRRKKA